MVFSKRKIEQKLGRRRVRDKDGEEENGGRLEVSGVGGWWLSAGFEDRR